VSLHPTEPERPFTAPWQAQAFALVVRLHENGVMSWPQWTQALARELQRSPEPNDYYGSWLSALESLLIGLDIVDERSLVGWRQAWQQAFRDTPHGHAIPAPKGPSM